MKIYLITYEDVYDGEYFSDELEFYLDKDKALDRYNCLVNSYKEDIISNNNVNTYDAEEEYNSPENTPFYKSYCFYDDDGFYNDVHILITVSERKVIE